MTENRRCGKPGLELLSSAGRDHNNSVFSPLSSDGKGAEVAMLKL